ncbi:XRE family transcriptional regulator [Salmonella enterica]|nr:XRE family transcriptional regulator [Salmonella enterica subsp. enterica serovar Hillingdon]ECB6312619.1 XRE family transcriptional regulator [Salmonella enterica subsp. enterica serovar Chailey]EDR3562114.1 XRE family transcriptional regulator [Salmonella enterica subsp. enterica serovar Benue]EFO8530542.1 XRE family transcriptional regulator [Salmonella enterica]MIW33701.1 XRE family transcriptional regulator [Salmonella enterica subsp. enterica serovar Derby]
MEYFRVRKHPDPAEILAKRKEARLTQTEAGKLVYSACRTWQQWEQGKRKMHPAIWELFQIKASQLADINDLYV